MPQTLLEVSVHRPRRPILALQAVPDMDPPWSLQYQIVLEMWVSSARGRLTDGFQYLLGQARFKTLTATIIRPRIQVRSLLRPRLMPTKAASTLVLHPPRSQVCARSQVQFRATTGAGEHGIHLPTHRQDSIIPALPQAA